MRTLSPTSALERITNSSRTSREVRKGPILLQKSAATNEAFVALHWSGSLDALALTLFTQLQRYAVHKALSGGGRATSIASRLKF